MIVQLLNVLCLKTADRVEIVTLLHFAEWAHKRYIFIDNITFEAVVNSAFMLLQTVPDMIPRCVRISEDRGTEHALIGHRYQRRHRHETMISFFSFDFVHDKFSISFSHTPTHNAIFITYVTPELIRW